MIKNKRPFLMLFFIILLGISSVSFWFFVFGYLKGIKDENSGLAEEIEATNQKIKKAKDLQNLYESLKNERDITENVVLNKENFINFIKMLESLAKSTNTELGISSAVMPQTPTEYPVLRLEIKGEYDKILKFIKLTENLPYITSFERITLQKDFAKTAGNPWSADINLKILSYR